MQNTLELPFENGSLKKALAKARAYLSLLKIWQTGLLLVTGFAGYFSAAHSVAGQQAPILLLGCLLCAISGSTVLNMVFDRDIDRLMERTQHRPLPSGETSPREALLVGLLLSAAGILPAFFFSQVFGAVVLTGLAFDMLYTLKLKRATPWSILLGGIAGGMPVLAGRVLATGKIDLAGIMLALAVVCWIPTHIVTFAIKHARDYERAGVPVVPNKYGVAASRRLVAASTALAAILIITVSWILGLKGSYLIAIAILCGLLITGAMAALLVRQPLLDHLLFKAASFFMLISSILITLGVGPSRW